MKRVQSSVDVREHERVSGMMQTKEQKSIPKKKAAHGVDRQTHVCALYQKETPDLRKIRANNASDLGRTVETVLKGLSQIERLGSGATCKGESISPRFTAVQSLISTGLLLAQSAGWLPGPPRHPRPQT